MFFRFLFGLQKGSMVWDSVPVLLFKGRINLLINFTRKNRRYKQAKRRFGKKEKSYGIKPVKAILRRALRGFTM